MEGKRPLRTQFAMKALDMSEMFQVTFGDLSLPGTPPRRVELTAPDGFSTAGGAQALQSITLVPDDPSAGTLVAGTVNGAANTAELRGFPYLEATHKMRFHGRKLDIPASSYQQLLEKVRTFLEGHGFSVTVVNQLPDAARRHYDANRPRPGTGATFWVLLAFMGLAVAGLAAYLLLTK